MSNIPQTPLEDSEIKVLKHLRAVRGPQTAQQIAGFTQQPLDEAIDAINRLGKKGMLNRKLDLTLLRITGESTSFTITEFGIHSISNDAA